MNKISSSKYSRVGDPFAVVGKPAVKSTGAMGGVSGSVSMLGLLLVKRFFPDLPEAEAIAIVSVLISLGLSLYGRVVAKTPITSLF